MSKRFGSRWALRDVSLQVKRGETVAVVGANGAGKTTLLRLLATLERPTTGRVTVAGHDAVREGHAVRARVGYAGHGDPLHPDLTLRENLRFAGRVRGLDEAGLDERIELILQELDLVHRAGDRAGSLSRGLAQRAGLALALLHDPPVLLLDEPFAGLDEASRRGLRRVVEAGGDRAVVVATHDPHVATDVADRILHLEAGRLRVDPEVVA